MNRRKFLQIFGGGVIATVGVATINLPTPATEVVNQVIKSRRFYSDIFEIKIDRFNTMRITRLQMEMCRPGLEAKGYKQIDNMFVHMPNRIDYYE